MNEWRPSLWFSGPHLEKVWDRARGMAEEDKNKNKKQTNICLGEWKALTELWSCCTGPSYTRPHFNLHISLQVSLTSPSDKCVSREVGLELRSPDFWFNLFLIHTMDPIIQLQIKPPSFLPSLLCFPPLICSPLNLCEAVHLHGFVLATPHSWHDFSPNHWTARKFPPWVLI